MLFLFIFSPLSANNTTQKNTKFLILITSYCNKDWYEKNLLSIFNQNYPRECIRIVYVDDVSGDGTADLVEAFVKKHGWEDRFILIKNKKRSYKTKNLYKAIHNFGYDDEVVFEYDGDDWLDNNNVLSFIDDIYRNNDIWVTYGNFWEWPSGAAGNWNISIPASVLDSNGMRKMRGMIWGALRTFKVWLFKKIKKEDLMMNGAFYQSTSDAAIMFPMLEMAGKRHMFIKERVYVHNTKTPLNDHKVMPEIQWKVEHHVRALPAYERLAQEDIILTQSM
jgi:glycosyltransferase involved in cell wall biosynthesis